MRSKLTTAVSDLDEEGAARLVKALLDAGDDPTHILEACQEGMMHVGKRFEAGEYFVSDLMVAANLFKTTTVPLQALTTNGGETSRGKIVFGTVAGDIHNIGKDIVVGLLRGGGYAVFDLGIDAPAQRFVDAVKETGAAVVGLSGLLTLAYDSMRDTVSALRAVDPAIKIMIGGGPMTAEVQQYTGADGWGANAQAAVTLADQWTERASRGHDTLAAGGVGKIMGKVGHE